MEFMLYCNETKDPLSQIVYIWFVIEPAHEGGAQRRLALREAIFQQSSSFSIENNKKCLKIDDFLLQKKQITKTSKKVLQFLRNPYIWKPILLRPKQKCIFWGSPNQFPFPKIKSELYFLSISNYYIENKFHNHCKSKWELP